MKIKTLLFEIQRSKIQTKIEMSKKVLSPSVTLMEKGTHFERAGSVLYIQKCAKMMAKLTKLLFCKAEIPVLIEGQNVSSIIYSDTLT